MKYFAVIDTNVIVSSLIKHDSNPGMIMELVGSGVIVPLVNEEILKEYSIVLKRQKFRFDESLVDDLLKMLCKHSLSIKRIKTTEQFIDKKDIVFYEIVLSGRQTLGAYLITGNLKHFPNHDFVITPKEMLDILESDINGLV